MKAKGKGSSVNNLIQKMEGTSIKNTTGAVINELNSLMGFLSIYSPSKKHKKGLSVKPTIKKANPAKKPAIIKKVAKKKSTMGASTTISGVVRKQFMPKPPPKRKRV